MRKLLTTAIVLMASLAQAEVVINEVMADNGEVYVKLGLSSKGAITQH